MQNKSFLSGVLVALAIVAVSAGALSVYANGKGEFNKKMNFNPEQRAEVKANMEAIRTAIDNNDYQAWQELNKDSKMAEAIDSQAKFDQLIRMHNLMKEGNSEEANQIAEELGLPMGHHTMNMGRGFGPDFKQGFKLQDINGDGYCDAQDQQAK
jgi:preprotein translocase subunit SecF